MLNVFVQECSLKFPWLQRAMENPQTPDLWQYFITNAFVVPFHLFLQFNIHHRKIPAFVKKGQLRPFWMSVLQLWFKRRYISSKIMEPDASELLQMPVCYQSCLAISMHTMHKVYAALTRFNIFTLEDFLSKKDFHPENMYIKLMLRRLPRHWLLLDPSKVDIQQTLYRGTMQQKWTVKAIYSHLRDRDSSRLPTAMAKWNEEIGMVGGPEWLKACEQIHSIRDIRLWSFHLLFLNRGYTLNVQRTHFALVSPLCRLCNGERETYAHLFWACPSIQLIIDTVRDIGIGYLDQAQDWLDQNSFLLGSFPTPLLTTLGLLSKRFILVDSISKGKNPPYILHPSSFAQYLRKYINQDRLRARFAQRECSFYSFWQELASPETMQDLLQLHTPPPLVSPPTVLTTPPTDPPPPPRSSHVTPTPC